MRYKTGARGDSSGVGGGGGGDSDWDRDGDGDGDGGVSDARVGVGDDGGDYGDGESEYFQITASAGKENR